MPDFFTSPAVQAGAAVLVLCVLTAVGFYVVSIFRDYAAEDQETAAILRDIGVDWGQGFLYGKAEF